MVIHWGFKLWFINCTCVKYELTSMILQVWFDKYEKANGVQSECILKIYQIEPVRNYYFPFKCNIIVIIMRNYHCNYDA